ncbi:glutamate--tRNA ligase [Candidatus Methanoperedens nitratireducens]|uniref:Glutamate--tRNA ligase n=1 Tax=Candidatus Methanoperedens nitratireducens TaxID=1392998 RepID=A0A284VIK0_9EURY|nr:glutamate--tRNA ligase [Candidatus Methanoperedens nitroreducens]SNQ59103.1 Glutamate--tRNA ligase [Candidatus Methanoperedens nitroreducens]
MLTNDEIKLLIKKYALQNAVKYKKTPQAGAVMGKVMANPELRSRAKEITGLVNEVLVEIEQMNHEAREEELKSLAPELIEELKEKKEPDKGLPPLEMNGPLVMRFAPNPNGPPTLGSARGIVVNSEYTRKYHGKLIIRFDDTDPATKRPMLEAYDWYLDDCRWLGAVPDEVVIASDRIPLYYEVAKELIRKDGAYVCFCEQEVFKALKDEKEACPHREQGVEKNLEFWREMLSGCRREQEAVLRIKTDIAHKDPAIRDWVAFRIIKTPHPRPEVDEKYCAWPLLDFEGAVEDHLLGTTLIIRGKDLADSEKRQRYVYEYMGWTYPKTMHWGRVQIHEFGKLSTSGIKKAIAEGIYTGWDDPRLPTIRAIRRRGIQPEALRKFMIDLGLGETDISLSLDTLYAENRKLVDPVANRYFFVWDPVEMNIEGAEPKIAKAPLHPSRGGMREIPVGTTVLVCRNDVDTLKAGERLRLKDLCNIQITGISPLTAKFIGTDMDLVKKEKARIIHWAPPDGLKVKVLSPDGEYTGIGERGIEREVDKVVQFERFGFVRIDSVSGDEVVAYFTHK